MTTSKPRVVVGISGGVDSSVAAHLLKESGYEVIGLFMKNWEEDDEQEYCAAAEDMVYAEEVCDTLKIPLRTINFSHEYWERVFSNFLSEHQAGRTPNPDVLCNKEIKFKEFLDYADSLGADYIATGHYVRRAVSGRNIQLLKGVDSNKDQSYFLYTLQQRALRRSLFPLGEHNKEDIRKIAADLGLSNHDRKDSTGICFIGERKFRQFLSVYLPPKPGEIRTLDDDEVIGKHEGLMYYTIGQRQGLGIGGTGGSGDAWYVADKDLSRKVLYVVQGREHPYLLRSHVYAGQVSWITELPPRIPYRCTARIRYRQQDQAGIVTRVGSNSAKVEFDEPQWAVTPGQSIVIYDQDVCLGGGIIENALEPED
ncbi:MAG: tRNA-specific 2-thiouridylase MnmA [marine bacterium B5-7]|nr:MAG: tRNA-specific 2-thiouridylase MnmA [marine bacterium B5-7]